MQLPSSLRPHATCRHDLGPAAPGALVPPRRRATGRLRVGLLLVAAGLLVDPARAARRDLDLARVELGLPGPPAAFFSLDLDGDAVRDLAVVVAYSTWEQTTSSELATMEGLDGVVEVMTVIPELADRRELLLFRGLPEGGFDGEPAVVALGMEVRSLASAGTAGPLLALTDHGVSALRLGSPEGEGGGFAGGAAVADAAVVGQEAGEGQADRGEPVVVEGSLAVATAGGPAVGEGAAAAPERSDGWHLVPLLEVPLVLAGARELLAELPFVADLDGDGRADLLLPTPDGLAIHLAEPPAVSFAATAAAVLPWPEVRERDPRTSLVPLPELRDLDGDGLPEVLLRGEDLRGEVVAIWRNRGGGRFAAPWRLDRALTQLMNAPASPVPAEGVELVWVGDLDGDGWGEVVLQNELELDDDAGMRAELRHAKSPPFDYYVVPLHRGPDGGLALEVDRTRTFAARGWALGADGDSDFPMPVSSGFQDLDGDGRQDLVALDLDFSIFQGLKALTIQRISLGIDFRVLCQDGVGRLREVAGLDLSGTFKLALRDLAVGTLVQFAGDFDGDGRADFVQMGRGRKVGIHRGQPGCRYPASPDLEITLAAAPTDLGTVEVRELDGDGRADLLLVQARRRSPGETGEGASLPVKLDLYLSRGRS